MAPKKRKNVEQQDSTDDESSSKRNKTESGLKFGLEWREAGEKGAKNLKPLIYLSADLPGCKKIASFDIDGTIIVTKSGKTFAQNSSDWKWFDKCVPQKLKDLDDQGFRIVFITNQAGIEKGKTKPEQLKTKFEAMLKELHIPVFILIATGENHFRKPSVEMWKFFEENCNKMEEVDMAESFYCGDAAGRPKNWAPGRSKDFSCGDRMFAANCNLKFFTPEEFFLNHRPVKFEWGSVDPLEVIKKYKNSKQDKEYHSTVQEIVMMFGPPASGKSTFYRRYLKDNNYVHVNRDTLQTQEKCLKAAEAALKEGKSVCVDNTNPSKKIRADYISLAKRMNVSQTKLHTRQGEAHTRCWIQYVQEPTAGARCQRRF